VIKKKIINAKNLALILIGGFVFVILIGICLF